MEFDVWSKWLDAAAGLSARYLQATDDDDPFAYNETASVSVLAAAAACAGFIGLAEFSTAKAKRTGRGHAWGRSDFWMQGGGRSWAFEFKQWTPVTPPRVTGRPLYYMEKARNCASKILPGDADRAVAGLIVPLHHITNGKLSRAQANLDLFAKSCEYAWKITCHPDGRDTYLFFNIVKRFV